MSLNAVASGERIHIGFFGMRNAGKSSLVNAVTGQELAVVSDVKGTTTDPVQKAMELLPLGPVVIIDTPGLDDEGELGLKRVEKARNVLGKTDIAILVVDGTVGLQPLDQTLIDMFAEKKLPYIIAYNKADLFNNPTNGLVADATKESVTANDHLKENEIRVSAEKKQGIEELKEKIGALMKGIENDKKIVADLLEPGDMVVLVIPIDKAAPKGRLILPQQQTIRDILDAGCMVTICQDTNLVATLHGLVEKPKMIITDSQVFGKIEKDVPEGVLFTSFSILFARYKGELDVLVKGAVALSNLKEGDKVLISEGCTHHRQCGDIGTEKMPAWVKAHAGCEPEFVFTSGVEFPQDLSDYKVIIHCGGCMLNEKEMKSRIARAKGQEIPMVNYGVAIAHMHGILKKSLSPFPDMQKLL